MNGTGPALHLDRGPRRIVCLTEEPCETLYALGESDRIVGISAYTERPAEAKRDKPVVSAFVGGSVDKIRALEPDLVIGFSDVQADLARKLIAENLQVLIFNQRSLQEILEVILCLSRLVDAAERGQRLVDGYLRRIEVVRAESAARGYRPRVYFEEWDEPLIAGSHWVSELVEIAGGIDVFAERSRGKASKERLVQADEVIAADPELVFASWCGKPFDAAAFAARPGFAQLAASKAGQVHEVPAEIILQPGPACLTDGLDFLHAALARLDVPS